MKKEMTIDEIKKVELDILIHLDKFCEKYNIRYYLAYGTLLGAIRHKGFIPWDDDIDVCMLRSDYERFRELYRNNNETPRYNLLDAENEKNYLYPILKLEDTNTLLIESNDRYCGVEIGVNIDIFPLDYVDENDDALEKQQDRLDLVRSFALFSLQKKHKSTGIKKMISKLLDMGITLLGKSYFNRRIIELTKCFAKEKSNRVLTMSWIYRAHTFPTDLFCTTSQVMFENYLFPAPNNPEKFLTIEYGDYMQLPSAEKRVRYHGFNAYFKSEVKCKNC